MDLLLTALVSAIFAFAAGCTRSEVAPEEDTQSETPSREEILKAWSEGRVLRSPFMPDPAQLYDIAESDPAHDMIEAYAASIKQRHLVNGVCERVIDYTKEVKGPASRRLSQNCRFFVCQWHDNSACFIDALALDKDLELTLIGPGQRHDRNFGDFLAEHKVKITDERSATLVWDAFCEVRRWPKRSNQIERVSDRLWRLGIPDDRDKGLSRAYYEVRLNDDSTIESAEWTIEGARDVSQVLGDPLFADATPTILRSCL